MDLVENKVGELINQNKTVRFGEHLIVKKATNTTIVIKNDAKLTCEESENCRFFHELKGEVELKKDKGSVKQRV